MSTTLSTSAPPVQHIVDEETTDLLIGACDRFEFLSVVQTILLKDSTIPPIQAGCALVYASRLSDKYLQCIKYETMIEQSLEFVRWRTELGPKPEWLK